MDDESWPQHKSTTTTKTQATTTTCINGSNKKPFAMNITKRVYPLVIYNIA